jgi:hypothetical protein
MNKHGLLDKAAALAAFECSGLTPLAAHEPERLQGSVESAGGGIQASPDRDVIVEQSWDVYLTKEFV